ncbi:MAG: polymerase [Mycobacterium sp.]|jgi:nucleotidyltransferase/DNA polymerase involved in DNA repair|nr:polymerase [Mycobacterium sp.]MDT5401121.1 polymerase [Mycobacterium sp.]
MNLPVGIRSVARQTIHRRTEAQTASWDSRTSTVYTRTKIRKLERPGTDPDVVTAAALAVLDLFELDRPIRLLGVRLELAMPIPRCAVLPAGGLLP